MSDADARDLDLWAGAIERVRPEAHPVRPLRLLGSGFRSVAVTTASGWVFRIGRSPDAAGDYAREWQVGGFLAERLGSILPRPRWYVAPCAEFPHGALAYQILPGEPPVWGVDPGAIFARDLGTFMARLHAIPVDAARTAGVPEVDAYRRALGAREVAMPLLSARLDADAFAALEAWWGAFPEDGRMHTARTAVCHHDLWHDNLLRSTSGRLSGVLDIAHVEISDLAHDFAAPRYFGDGFMAELVSAYRAAGGRVDADDEYRADRFFEAREFGGLAWAIEHYDDAEIEDAVRKISSGPILRPRSSPAM